MQDESFKGFVLAHFLLWYRARLLSLRRVPSIGQNRFVSAVLFVRQADISNIILNLFEKGSRSR